MAKKCRPCEKDDQLTQANERVEEVEKVVNYLIRRDEFHPENIPIDGLYREVLFRAKSYKSKYGKGKE